MKMGNFLRKHLSALGVNDPVSAKNSKQVIEFLREGSHGIRSAFSVDVEDLFYSIPHKPLLLAVRECIGLSGIVDFQNSCGTTVKGFLELLGFYLSNTSVSFEGGMYVQKRGICIGSSVAPVLSNIFLSKCGEDISERLLRSEGSFKLFTHVDDFLIFGCSMDHSTSDVMGVLAVFRSSSFVLTFTHELPKEEIIQFLDLRLSLLPKHICWIYAPRSRKGIHPYYSCNLKLVKGGIASSYLEASLRKSCQHSAQESFEKEVDRLQRARFPVSSYADECG